MSVVPISKKSPTVQEQRDLESHQQKLADAEQAYNSAILARRKAHSAEAKAKRDHKRALEELTKYRTRIGL